MPPVPCWPRISYPATLGGGSARGAESFGVGSGVGRGSRWLVVGIVLPPARSARGCRSERLYTNSCPPCRQAISRTRGHFGPGEESEATRSLPDHVPVVLHVVGQLVLLDRPEARPQQVLARLLLAPHRPQPLAPLRQRHRHAVH